jgi:hypothetical protein
MYDEWTIAWAHLFPTCGSNPRVFDPTTESFTIGFSSFYPVCPGSAIDSETASVVCHSQGNQTDTYLRAYLLSRRSFPRYSNNTMKSFCGGYTRYPEYEWNYVFLRDVRSQRVMADEGGNPVSEGLAASEASLATAVAGSAGGSVTPVELEGQLAVAADCCENVVGSRVLRLLLDR